VAKAARRGGMAKRLTKIEKYGLGGRVVELAFKERQTDTAIARILTEESGVSISQPTVTRWLQEKREATADDVRTLLVDHTHKELPKDLDALEEMQLRLMTWAKERPEETHERVRKEIPDEDLIAFAETVQALPPVDQERGRALDLVRAFMRRVSDAAVGVYKNRQARTDYMDSARKIITSKLQYAGAMEATTAGNIIIKTHDRDPDGDDGGGEQKPVRMTLVRGGAGA